MKRLERCIRPTPMGGPSHPGDTTSDNRVDDFQHFDLSIPPAQRPAYVERVALASLQRQRRRDVLNKRRCRAKSLDLPRRDDLLSRPSLSLPTSWPPKADGTLNVEPSGFRAPESPTRVGQLEHENQQLRKLLRAAMSSCNEAEPSRRDQAPYFEVGGRCMPGRHAAPFAQAPTHDAADRTAFQDHPGLPRFSPGPSDGALDAREPLMPTLQAEEPAPGSVERALWEAANRPVRPKEWASLPFPPPPFSLAEPHADVPAINGLTAPGDYHHPPQPHQQSKNSRPTSAAQWNMASSFLNDANLYVLPDVPGGLESVDRLATHIPMF